MCLTKLLTGNNEMKTLQSNHVPPRTNNLVWLRGNAASSHPCKSSGSSYEEFPIPDGLVRSSRPTPPLPRYRIVPACHCVRFHPLSLNPLPHMPGHFFTLTMGRLLYLSPE